MPLNRTLRRLSVSRRAFLRSTGVAMALPLLDPMMPAVRAASDQSPNRHRRRFVGICHPLGLHAENFYPAQTGAGFPPSPYLEPMKGVLDRLTVFSGVSHPEVDGGHSADACFLTAAPHPGQPGFRNTISVDQYAAELIGADTRYPYLALSAMGNSLSWTRAGVRIPGEFSAAKLYAKLFLDGSAADMDMQMRNLKDGRSIMDAVNDQARQMSKSLGARDREKLEEYFTSVRDLEKRLALSQDWAHQPKPKVDYKQPTDPPNKADLIARMGLMYDLVFLAIQTDSSRLFTFMGQGSNLVPPIPGVSVDHHQLSHHGKDPEKIAQLSIIELEEMKLLAGFLTRLAATREDEAWLLDRTMVLVGSNLGNASSHDNRNLPILLAGGPFKHGQHLAFDRDHNKPIANLFVAALQQLGLPVDRFASSNAGSLPGFDARSA
jgi:hypothetical protein